MCRVCAVVVKSNGMWESHEKYNCDRRGNLVLPVIVRRIDAFIEFRNFVSFIYNFMYCLSHSPCINYLYSLCSKETVGITTERLWNYYALALEVNGDSKAAVYKYLRSPIINCHSGIVMQLGTPRPLEHRA